MKKLLFRHCGENTNLQRVKKSGKMLTHETCRKNVLLQLRNEVLTVGFRVFKVDITDRRISHNSNKIWHLRRMPHYCVVEDMN